MRVNVESKEKEDGKIPAGIAQGFVVYFVGCGDF